MNSTLYKAWLQHTPVEDQELRSIYSKWFGSVVVAESSEVITTAVGELTTGIHSLLGIKSVVTSEPEESSYLRIETLTSTEEAASYVSEDVAQLQGELGAEGFILRHNSSGVGSVLTLTGGSATGVLYGVFHLLRLIASGKNLEGIHVVDRPRNRLRMINQWDNADGEIERGYAGKSIFYQAGKIVEDVQRVRDYARMLASVGINSISINNVNVHEIETSFITPEQLPEVARIAGVFRTYGIRLFLSVNFAAPLHIGEVGTSDPLDEGVRNWWAKAASDIYKVIPDFGGFVVKADSEHRPGPFAYGRDHADGANMLAEALQPYGGLVIWRCFVYNCMQDWRDRSTDRARAAYDHFKPLDGKFHDNVLLQIKNGPMDFQVREPVSPLFGAMKQTNQVMEFQITQEYTGQQRHVCYLVPQWKEVLDFDTHAEGPGTHIHNIVDGTQYNMLHSGVAAVSSIGDDENWTGHTLAQANLYGYGRLIWNPSLSAEDIAEEWVKLTFGCDEQVVMTVRGMLMMSWPIYESYTSPLGVGWMVTPHYHYGPDVDGYEYSRWGTYHFADRNGIGVDRTLGTGTKYVSQYSSPNDQIYGSVESCPDELLLFFHHVPYEHVLQSGKTVIQHIYDTHFEGAQAVQWLNKEWNDLEGKIDEDRFTQVAGRLAEQATHANHWRDVINTYFYRKSGVPDAQGRTIF